METPIQPLLLLADSQLLFWRGPEGLFLEEVRRRLPTEAPKAAYLGASNGDLPEFYDLFAGAMAGAGISNCRHIAAEPSDEDRRFVDEADLILLAGGDTQRGWKALQANGLAQRLLERYYSGALLVGVSAGAVQMGLFGAGGDGEIFETMKLVPFFVDAHDEPDWPRLTALLPKVETPVRGLGLPSGAGAWVHPDLTLEPIRSPLVELQVADGEVIRALIFPPGPEEVPLPEPGWVH